MAKTFPTLSPELRDWIAEQKIFFVGTATDASRVNISPKGMDTFRCLDENTACYLDLTGSGNETAAHLAADGRMTILFCAFDGPPRILRLYGRGRAVRPRDAEWDELFAHFEQIPGARQILVLDFDLVQTSCGFAVPLMDFQGEREILRNWAVKKVDDGALETYWQEKNTTSLDGLPTGLLDGPV